MTKRLSKTNTNTVYLIKKQVENFDKSISTRLTKLRQDMGLDSYFLANILGMEEQELLDYEQATKEIPASMLIVISCVLGVNIEYFYDVKQKELSHYLYKTGKKVANQN